MNLRLGVIPFFSDGGKKVVEKIPADEARAAFFRRKGEGKLSRPTLQPPPPLRCFFFFFFFFPYQTPHTPQEKSGRYRPFPRGGVGGGGGGDRRGGGYAGRRAFPVMGGEGGTGLAGAGEGRRAERSG